MHATKLIQVHLFYNSLFLLSVLFSPLQHAVAIPEHCEQCKNKTPMIFFAYPYLSASANKCF